MDGDLLAELLNGPFGYLVAIAALLYLAAKEYRKARTERVEDAEAEVAREQRQRLAAETERDTVRREGNETRQRLESKLEQVRTELQGLNEATSTRYWKARQMLIERGVSPEDIP